MSEKRERRLNVRLDPETHKAMRKEAAEQDCSLQELAERAIRRLLGLPEQPDPDAGRKGGAVYPRSGHGSMLLADGE